MYFDITTPEAARDFTYELLGMNPSEILQEYYIVCEQDFEKFWVRKKQSIRYFDVDTVQVKAFHILGSLDDCQEIREQGLKNLQRVLSEDTCLSRELIRTGIVIDVPNKTIRGQEKLYSIDYETLRRNLIVNSKKEALEKIARRIYYDHCVNGFLVCDDVCSYGTDIHRRPEFLLQLSELLPEATDLEQSWGEKSKSYRIDFYATIDQIHRFTFELDEETDPPFVDWVGLDDQTKLTKWMLYAALERMHGNSYDRYLYIKENFDIPPNQILNCSLLY